MKRINKKQREHLPVRKVRVKSPYHSPFPDPIKLKRGEKVKVEKRVCEWSGWVWCEDIDGKTGWVPQSYVQIKGNSGKLLVDYDATELSVKKGEELKILKEESSWFWCRNRKGDSGWVRKDKVSFR